MRSLLALLVVPALVSMACSSGTNPGSGGGGAGTGAGGAGTGGSGASEAAAFATTYTTALCDRLAMCRPLSQYVRDACPAEHALTNEVKAVASGRAAFDASAAAACLQDLAALDCTELVTLPDTIAHTLASCGNTFTGAVDPGQPCYGSEECKDGFCVNDASCPGVCHANKKPGDACTGNDCGYADRVCSGTCGAIGKMGDACGPGTGVARCELGLWCTGHCGPRAAKGESCASIPCAHGLACNDAVCVDPPGEGAPCKGIYACADGLVCAGTWVSDTPTGFVVYPGVCSKPSDVGGPCVNVSGWPDASGCGEGLLCSGNKCVMPPSSGECAFGEDLYACGPGLYCTEEHQCAPQLAAGDACAFTGNIRPCAGADCVNGVCVARCLAP